MTFGLKKATLSASILAVGLAGCADGNGGQIGNQQAGTAVGGLLGAVAGGLAGTQVGDGRGRTVAIIAGTILGGAVGATIGNRLTQQDQLIAQQTTQRALETAPPNQPVRWENPQTGVRGEIVPTTPIYSYTPVSTQQTFNQQPAYTQPTYTQPTYNQQPAYVDSTYSAQPAFNPQPATSTQSCREYKQTIVIADQIETAKGTACRQPDGSWKIVS